MLLKNPPAPAPPSAAEFPASQHIRRLVENVSRVFIGKEQVVTHAVLALVSGGHVLIEDVPGLGKTLLAKALARSLAAGFKRVQFTADLLPSDITGVTLFAPERQEFTFRRGPVFTNILLADEINRATPRTQSALLEAMEEQSVTVDGQRHALEWPFFVLATQNPVELEGTYPLPFAQMDRFMVRLSIGYLDRATEMRLLQMQQHDDPLARLEPVMTPDGSGDGIGHQSATQPTAPEPPPPWHRPRIKTFWPNPPASAARWTRSGIWPRSTNRTMDF